MSRAQDVIIASLNVHGGRGADGTPFDLAAACTLLEADVIVLQEAWHPDGQPDPAAQIASALGARLIRADLRSRTSLSSLGIARETAPGRWGLAVLTRLPVTACEVADLGHMPFDSVPRAALLVTVEVPGGGSLRVANAHLTHRFTSPVQLLRLAHRLGSGGVPTVIAGDLNMPGPLTGLAAGYRPAVTGRTFPAHRPLLQLDHVLTGRGVTGHDGEVLPPAGSDHLPVRARLRLA